jgi:hypothetical protein
MFKDYKNPSCFKLFQVFYKSTVVWCKKDAIRWRTSMPMTDSG